MTDLLHPATDEPRPVGDRAHAEPEIHRLPLRDTAVIVVDVAPDELPDAIGRAIGEVTAAMAEAAVGLAGPPFTRYLAFEPRIRAEVGFAVMRPAPDIGRVEPGRLPGGRAASVLHIGSYDGLEQTYALLTRWLAELGLRTTGPMWEVYWSDPATEPDPASWRTEIFAPIE
jgi:effector-binding domain-containing protein